MLKTRNILCAAALFSFSVSIVNAFNKDRLNEEAKRHLINLVNINTSQPKGNELDAARYIYLQLNKENIDWDIIKTGENRTNIIAYIKSASPTPAKPLFLVSHLDTVGVVEENWNFPAFKATEKDGFIYGRGTADCKDLTAINLTVLLEIKRSGVELNRDIIFIATADEEAGSRLGMQYLIKNYPEIFSTGFALTEGGGIITDEENNPKIIFLAAADKINLNIRLISKGIAQHSAVGEENNSIYNLTKALENIRKHKFDYKLNPMTQRFFKDIYPFQSPDAKTTIDMLLSEDEEKVSQAAETISVNPFFNSQIRDTITPTVLSAGSEYNIAPQTAQALLNCRLLYDSGVDEFIGKLKQVIDNDNIEVHLEDIPQASFPLPMPLSGELFESIVKTSIEFMPESVVTGASTTGTTDAEFLRRAGIITYGVGSAQSYGSHTSIHGPDENILLSDFYSQLEFIYRIVKNFTFK